MNIRRSGGKYDKKRSLSNTIRAGMCLKTHAHALYLACTFVIKGYSSRKYLHILYTQQIPLLTSCAGVIHHTINQIGNIIAMQMNRPTIRLL